MNRRDFLQAIAASSLLPGRVLRGATQPTQPARTSSGSGYASPAEAMKAEREKLLYVTALYTGTKVNKPDFLATVDVDPKSPTYSKVIHRLAMPTPGDELHHFGWNACSGCHGDPRRTRRYLVVPGVRSSRIHVIDAIDPRALVIHKVIEPDAVKKTNLSAPHTVHCLASGEMLISMLGDAEGNGPGGFLLLDDQFNIAGKWHRSTGDMKFNYDFWYQPRHNVMVSSEWGAPRTYSKGFDPKDVEAGKYGRHIHFWDWKKREIAQSIDLGETGMIPLEVRFLHDPASTHGFVGAALSSTMWHFHKPGDSWKADKVIEVPSVAKEGWPFPVPGLITDLVVSMDDRYLYFSNWLHGDIRQYDIRDPARPKLTGQVWLGGVLGKEPSGKRRPLVGGPQMLQLSLDGRRLYVTSSLLSSWDNQFYADMAEKGSYLMQIDCNVETGGMKVNESFFVDFGAEPAGPARAHEMRYPGGDCTSDIFA